MAVLRSARTHAAGRVHGRGRTQAQASHGQKRLWQWRGSGGTHVAGGESGGPQAWDLCGQKRPWWRGSGPRPTQLEEALVGGLRPGNHAACGSPRVGFRPRTPAGLPGPKWAGVTLASFPSHPPVPQRSLSVPADRSYMIYAFFCIYISMKSLTRKKKASPCQSHSVHLKKVNEYILGNQYNF